MILQKIFYTKNRLISLGFFILFLFSAKLYSQSPTEQDSIKNGVDLGKLELPNPKSVVEAYTYDPNTNRYLYTNTANGFNVNWPLILTPKQYNELVLREKIRDYYQEKSAAIDGKKDGSAEAQRNLLPKYYVNSKFFETLFGSNEIDIKPNGTLAVDLGVRYTKQDNPSFSPRNRKTTAFDFDQRISVGLQGKVGTRLGVNINYDTESTFAFQNLVKLEFGNSVEGQEDDILKKLEVGNVSFPLSNSLIRGAQSLFGVKTELQFGKTTVSAVFSEQKSQTRSVATQGGGTLQDFEMFALDYDADRHYFLSQYFRNKYDKALQQYPFINSRVQITRIEVWITNKQNRISSTENNLRNIVALQDLGEADLTDLPTDQIVGVTEPGFFNVLTNSPTDNKNNKFDPNLIGSNFLNSQIRDIALVNNGFNISNINEGTDYAKLENARKLTESEFTYHPQLGYISLRQRLANDEVLAVAFQYTIGDEVYQVGEFGTDGIESTQVDTTVNLPQTQALILKMLKGNLVNVEEPAWDLMMKNIYQIPGAFQLEQEDFKFNIMYTDPSPINYITKASVTAVDLPADVKDTPLLKVLNVDKLNYTNDPQQGGDGFFDFIPGLTVDQQNGRIIFTTVEPFGSHLFSKLKDIGNPAEDYDVPPANGTNGSYNENQAKYVFRNLYKSTQAAALQESEKNKFQLKGRFKSTGGDGISIGAFNIPPGSVVVTAGGRLLVEGVDYTVNYQAGRVNILDPSLQSSNTPIDISVENNQAFGQQTRRFFGVNVEHKFSENFLLGATYLRMSERPFTVKSNYGQESVNNSIFGLNTIYTQKLPFLTRWVNKLPNIDTDVESNMAFRGEVAYLKPGASKADQFNGEATVYVDDFEGSQTTIDMRSPLAWTHSSVPIEGNFDGVNDNTESPTDDISIGYKRARLNWYSIDPLFYTQRPNGITNDDLSLNATRRVFNSELFPNLDIAQGQSTVVNTLDLSYYPKERGIYNFNPNIASTGEFSDLEALENWGGIMRSINSTNFEQANVEYVQFWIMDPFYGQAAEVLDPSEKGKLVINLGEISEDVLKDGRKLYENGLPEAGSNTPTYSSNWGNIPASQSLVYAFDTNNDNRAVQDLGFDGLNDALEAQKFSPYSSYEDPSNDNYQFYLEAEGGILDRYKKYNGVQGNSPVDVTNNNRGNNTLPDVEDVNRDNTMNTINAYFKYEVGLGYYPDNAVPIGQNFITDVRVDDAVELPNATIGKARWIQYKIPIQEFTDANKVGNINDMRSIRFMRMYIAGFSSPVTLRFGALDLVRGDWRRFTSTLDANDPDTDDDNTGFDITSVNILENTNRNPIPYVTPPGVVREQLINNNTIINQNEQSLSLRVYDKLGTFVHGLEKDDSRGVFKNVNVDMRQFKKLRMFLHAEALPSFNGEVAPLQDDELTAFIRFGNDFTENFYQVEIPLKVTAEGATIPEEIWPVENEIEVPLALLTKLKILSINNTGLTQDVNGISFLNEAELGSDSDRLTIGIKGNPNFGLVRTIMVGLKNKNSSAPLRGEVWFNELRMSEMDNKGGYAAVASLDANVADFARVSATTRMSTIGFGSLEEGPNERSREDVFQYDMVANLNLGQLLPKKWGVNLPFNYGVGEETITPKYDPFYQDITIDQILEVTDDAAQQSNITSRAIDYTKRTSINFIGVRKDKNPEKKPHFYDVENLTFSHSQNETEHHDYEIENLLDLQNKTTVDYAYTFTPLEISPLKKSAMSKKKYLKLLTDFNFNLLPANVSFSSNIIRQFNKQEFRLIDVEGIGLDPLYRRNYFFNYNYGFNYNLTKSLRINYTANSNNIVRNYLDDNNMPDNGLDIWNDYWNPGEANLHNQKLIVNYDLPFYKLPFLSFLRGTYSYTSDFNWQRSSNAFSSIIAEDGNTFELGNTIQNANTHALNTTFNMDQFYKYIGLTKTKNARKPKKPKTAPKPGEKIVAKPKPASNEGSKFKNGLIDLATSVKKIQASYNETNGTVLPGYLPGLGFFGTSKATIPFVFGSQSDIRYETAKNGYLTNFPDFNQNFTQVTNKQLNITAQLEPLKDFKIDINAERMYASTFSEQFDVSNGQYNSRSPNSFGNFSISTIMLGTAFKASTVDVSETFQNFRDNRAIIANRLAAEYYGNNPIPDSDGDGYPDGFGKGSQRVLLPAFIAAYTNKDASTANTGLFRNIPLPNWNIKYTGLMKLGFFKENFKRFSVQHGYRASYNINQFRSNLNQSPVDANGNFFSENLISNVNLAEQFNPLVRLDFELKNAFNFKAEIKKDRTLNMSFDNNLLTEVSGQDFTLGLGYRIKDVTMNSTLASSPTGVIKSDINLKADFTLRKNNTLVRYLDYDNNQLGGGQDIWSIRFTADYTFSKNLTAIFYYDHQFSQAVISTSFPITNIRSGFTLQYTFGN